MTVAIVILAAITVAGYGAVTGSDAATAQEIATPFVLVFLALWGTALYRLERHRDRR